MTNPVVQPARATAVWTGMVENGSGPHKVTVWRRSVPNLKHVERVCIVASRGLATDNMKGVFSIKAAIPNANGGAYDVDLLARGEYGTNWVVEVDLASVSSPYRHLIEISISNGQNSGDVYWAVIEYGIQVLPPA